MAKVLISGGSGFLGRAIRESLSLAQAEVSLLVRHDSSIITDLARNETKRIVEWPADLDKIDYSEYDFFIYLSHAPVTESMSYSEVEKVNLLPLKLVLKGLKDSKSTPHLVFVSSQAAISKNKSNYGNLKYDSEVLIKEAGIPATIFRPGLITGKGQTGLFNSINKFIRMSPLIPVIGQKSDQIQIIFIEDFIKIMLLSTGLSISKPASGFRIIEAADRPLEFSLFLKRIAEVQGLKRVFFRVPNALTLRGFWILENIFRYRKITSSSFLGFLSLELLDHQLIWNELGFKPLGIDEAIKRSVGNVVD